MKFSDTLEMPSSFEISLSSFAAQFAQSMPVISK